MLGDVAEFGTEGRITDEFRRKDDEVKAVIALRGRHADRSTPFDRLVRDGEPRRAPPPGPGGFYTARPLAGPDVQHYHQVVALGSAAELVDALAAEGRRTKVRHNASGPHRGGCPFRRGTLFHLLRNRIYLGEIVHKGESHHGEHAAIVPQALRDEVLAKLAKLAEHGPGTFTRTPTRSALAGLPYDGLGRPMTPSHAMKGSARYRYYPREPSPDEPAWRVGAHDVGQAVAGRIRALLLDRNLIVRLVLRVTPWRVDQAVVSAAALASKPVRELRAIGVTRIDLMADMPSIAVSERALRDKLGIATDDEQDGMIQLDVGIARVRREHGLRLIVSSGVAEPAPMQRDDRPVSIVAESRQARALVLTSSERTSAEVATVSQRCRKRLAKLVRLSFLAPDIVQLILRGEQPPSLTPAKLLDLDLPIDWQEQRTALALALA